MLIDISQISLIDYLGRRRNFVEPRMAWPCWRHTHTMQLSIISGYRLFCYSKTAIEVIGKVHFPQRYTYGFCRAGLSGPALLSDRGAVRSSRFVWISGPITTVQYELNRPKAAAAAKVSFPAWRWFTVSIRGGMVVHGNQPISVSRIAIMMNGHD